MAETIKLIKRTFMTKILANFIWVDEINGALNLAARIKAESDYAVDTEFERSRTFYLNPALLQISCDGQIYLVDIAIPEVGKTVLGAIRGLVLHSGSEDLELWYQVTQEKPLRVFDTQVAAALCGFSLHTSYLNLVQELVGVALDKAMSRSDWLARPLSDAQIQYAVEDIVYLDEFKQILTVKMQERGMLDLFDVLMQQMIDGIDQDGHNEKLFQKLVKSERLKHPEAQKLWRLLHWRDALARKRNKPRNWILNPKQIIEVVKKGKHFSDLFHLGLHPNFVKHNGKSLLEVLHNDEPSQANQAPVNVKLSRSQADHLSAMKQRLDQVAQRCGIEPSIIVNAQSLKKMAFEGKELSDLPTWHAII